MSHVNKFERLEKFMEWYEPIAHLFEHQSFPYPHTLNEEYKTYKKIAQKDKEIESLRSFILHLLNFPHVPLK